MGVNESISHYRRIETVRLINLLQEEMIRDIELREEWQMKCRALYVQAVSVNTKQKTKHQEITDMIKQLHNFWDK